MTRLVLLFSFLSFLSSLSVQAQNAPVTSAGIVSNAVPGTQVTVPVTVTGFNDIGQFTLTMMFKVTRIAYVSAVTNPALAGMTVTYVPPSGNSYASLILSWTGASNASLPGGSSLADLTFAYTTGTGILSWVSECQYKRYVGTVLTPLNSTPQNLYFMNGGISNRTAPVTTAPVVTIAAPGTVSVPVTVTGFTNIGAVSLSLDYNYSVLHYTGGTPNPLLGGFSTGDQDLGNGYHRITMGWYTSTFVTLANGATIITLNFTFLGGNTSLSWFDNGPSCEYTDGPGDVLIDMPAPTYYKNGGVTAPLVANFTADNLSPPKNTTVTFTDLTTGGPTGWEWSFDRASVVFVNGTTFHSQHPQVQFTEGGLYSVSLIASNSYLTDPEVKTGYVRAGTAGLWTGVTSSDWAVTTNWDNWLVPTTDTDVVIPPVAPAWPVYDGDLTIGVQCKSIVISGATGQLTVTGTLTLPDSTTP